MKSQTTLVVDSQLERCFINTIFVANFAQVDLAEALVINEVKISNLQVKNLRLQRDLPTVPSALG